MSSALIASILSVPFINPLRFIEKQERVLNPDGKYQNMISILRASAKQNFKPLFRGSMPLVGHSFASASLGLVGQPVMQKKIELYFTDKIGKLSAITLASAIVSPFYILITNPISRIEVIMKTAPINGTSKTLLTAFTDVMKDYRIFGINGFFRGQMVGVIKATVSLSSFHIGKTIAMTYFENNATNALPSNM